MKKNRKGIVYSTNTNYEYENEEIHVAQTLIPEKQVLNIFIENYKGGKKAVIIKNFIGSKKDIEILAKMLKNKCGVGGSVKKGKIIIQGDNREKVINILNADGYITKRIGG